MQKLSEKIWKDADGISEEIGGLTLLSLVRTPPLNIYPEHGRAWKRMEADKEKGEKLGLGWIASENTGTA